MNNRQLALWVWTLPLVFVIHDSEEVVTMVDFLRTNADRLPGQLRSFTSSSNGQFVMSVLLLLVLILIFCFLARRANYSGLPMMLFVLLTAILFGNGLNHLGQAVILGGYTPGLITSPFLFVFTLFALRAFWKTGFLTRRNFLPIFVGGFLLQLPLIVVALAFGRLFPL